MVTPLRRLSSAKMVSVLLRFGFAARGAVFLEGPVFEVALLDAAERGCGATVAFVVVVMEPCHGSRAAEMQVWRNLEKWNSEDSIGLSVTRTRHSRAVNEGLRR